MSEEKKYIKELREKVERYLREKGLSYEVKPDGTLWVRQGSTVVVVHTTPWGKGDQSIVKLAAPVALKVSKISSKLTRFLIEKNSELLFGKFSLNPSDQSVWYEHALLGDYLDLEELFVAVATIAITADKYDEEVCAMTGGKRLIDM